MAADLSRDMLAGAQLVNMGWQRQERMMQLRAQAAAQQMQERQIAAQAQMLTEHARLYRIQADQEEQDAKDQAAVTQAAADHFDYLYNDLQLDKDEAAQTSILAASLVHPVAGEKMAKAYNELQQGIARTAKGKMGVGGLSVGEAIPITDPNDPRKVLAYATPSNTETGAMHFINPQEGGDKLSSTGKKAEEKAALQRKLDQLNLALTKVKGWNPQEESKIKQEIKDTATKLEAYAGSEFSLTTTPEGGLQINYGQGKTTVGTQTMIQTELAGLQNSIVQIDNAMNSIREKDVGVSGKIWSDVVNSWVSQVIPEASDPSVSSNRVALQKAVDSYLATMQSRGRLSAAERAEIRNALVTLKLGESLPRAKSILDVMSRIQKLEAVSRAKAGNQALQPWMFNGLKKDEIRQLWREGVLGRKEAENWLVMATPYEPPK